MPEQHCRLLIVDDSLEDRTVMRLLLEDSPGRTWNFIEEEKGGDALSRLETDDVDCILLDYQLPEMNGLRFLHELTRRFGQLRFPVVMFTGSGRASVAVEAMKAGAQDYLSKDIVRIDTLIHAIDNARERIALFREREKHRAEIEATNARLRLLEAAVQATRESVLITDAQLDLPGPHILFVNPGFTAMTGYSEQDAIGKTPRILQGPNTDRAVVGQLRRNLAEGQPFSGQAVNYRKDGSEFILDWAIAPICDSSGQLTHFVSVQRDDTQRHLAEKQLRESEQRLDLALHGADLGLWDFDFITGHVAYDQRWLATLGFDLNDVEPTLEGWFARMHPEDVPAVRELFERHCQGETPSYEAEFRMQTSAGKWHWILSRGKVLSRAPDGSPARMLGTHLDITGRRNAELAVERSNEDLRQFASAVGHDLNEPLRMITSYSQLLVNQFTGKLQGDGELFLHTIQNVSRKASRMLADLLAYSQAGVEGQDLLTTPCSCDAVLDAALATCQDLIAESGAILERDPLPVIRVHRAQLEQLFLNLIGNALKYRRPEEPPRIHVSASFEGAGWTFSVRDNGIGFHPDQAAYIFGPFKRLHGRERSGVGLGLAICRRIVENHGGRIWADSTPGVGSTFRFSLPLRAEAVPGGGREA